MRGFSPLNVWNVRLRSRNSMIRLLLHIAAVLAIFSVGFSQDQPIFLWSDGQLAFHETPPSETVRIFENGEQIVSNVHRPSLTPYIPPKGKATGAAVIIVPGGGHRELWMDHEGYRVAEWLKDRGVAAFVLKYRLAREEGSTYTIERTELSDVKRAIRLVRSRAAEWDLDRQRIGIIGFSAGGELAAMASTRFDSGTPGAADVIERESSRPDFQALIYPAIPANMHLSTQTPPAFLICGEDDRPEISQGIAKLHQSMRQAGMSAELHIYAHTGHGFGMRQSNPPSVSGWIELFYEWLGTQKMLGPR
jgi:acetyl esterase/lipase